MQEVVGSNPAAPTNRHGDAMAMLETLEIRNYRGFESYAVRNLAPVNLVVGQNNVGKTSILEAAQLLQSSSPLSLLATNYFRRIGTDPRRPVGFEPSRTLPGSFLESAFFGHSAAALTAIGIRDGSGRRLSISISDQNMTEEGQLSLENDLPNSNLIVDSFIDGRHSERAILMEDGSVERWPRLLRNFSSSVVPSEQVPPEGLSHGDLSALAVKVLVHAEEQRLLEAMQILDSSIQNVIFLPGSDRSSRHKELILLAKEGKRLLLSSFGDGMRRMLGLALAFVNARGGQLLIDEIDSGLHYTKLEDMWRLVIKTSSDLDCQVFATTHSSDCLKGLRDALEKEPDLADHVAVHKIDRRLTTAITLRGANLLEALRYDIELR